MSSPASWSRYARAQRAPSRSQSVGARVAERLAGQRELGGAPLQVVAPRRLRVERVGQGGDDVGFGRRARSWRAAKIAAAVASSRRARAGSASASTCAASANAAAIRPARFGRQRRPGRWRGTPGGGAGSGSRARRAVVRLGQPPQVVVAVEGARLVARADPDLEVQRCPVFGSHARRASRWPKRASAPSVGRRLRAQLPLRRVHEADGVGGGVGELDEVAGVEPAAREVDRGRRSASRRRPTIDVAVRVLVGRPGVDVEVAVVEVRRACGRALRGSRPARRAAPGRTRRRRDHARPEQLARASRSGTMGRWRRAGHRQDPIRPGLVDGAEVQEMDRSVGGIPGPLTRPDRAVEEPSDRPRSGR